MTSEITLEIISRHKDYFKTLCLVYSLNNRAVTGIFQNPTTFHYHKKHSFQTSILPDNGRQTKWHSFPWEK